MKYRPQRLNFTLWCANTSYGVPRYICCRQIYHSDVDPLVLPYYTCNDVEKANQWCILNGMIVNYARKHQALIRGQTDHQFCLPVNYELDIFGMTIDNILNFDSHISAVCNKINNQFNVMLRFRNTFSKNTMFKFYKTFILPHFFIIVQYGIQLWYTQQ